MEKTMTVAITTLCILSLGCSVVPQSSIKPIDKPDTVAQLSKRHPEAYTTIPVIGIVGNKVGSPLVIKMVTPNSGANNAGLQVGDSILSIDNIPVESMMQVQKILIQTKHPGDTIACAIEHNGNISTKQIVLSDRIIRLDGKIMLNYLLQDKEVRLAILIGDITNPAYSNQAGSDAFSQWKKGIEMGLISQLESSFIMFNGYKNFNLVDRQHIENVLSELKFQQTGLTSENTTLNLGKTLGATHLIIINFARFVSSSKEFKDVCYEKIIDVESGKILTSFQVPMNNDGIKQM